MQFRVSDREDEEGWMPFLPWLKGRLVVVRKSPVTREFVHVVAAAACEDVDDGWRRSSCPCGSSPAHTRHQVVNGPMFFFLLFRNNIRRRGQVASGISSTPRMTVRVGISNCD